jgi:exodeoxyribonuclease V alpha subunit
MSLASRLRRAALSGQVRAIDAELGIRIGQLAGDGNQENEPLAAAAAVVSHAIAAGHSCVPLAHLQAQLDAFGAQSGIESMPDAATVATALARSALVGRASDDVAPLVIEHQRLYLQRYAHHEQYCAARLQQMLSAPVGSLEGMTERLHPGSKRYLFSDTDAALDGQINWQSVACAVALRHRLSVFFNDTATTEISTLALIALLLLEDARSRNPGTPFRIALAAPTGKAAQRLRESLGQRIAEFEHRFVDRIDGDDLIYLKDSGKTLHRLLGARPDQLEFRHNERNPLEADCLIVDESSMVDLPLMSRTLRALARLILVGDRQQLYPVEAGSVFAELFELCQPGLYDPATAQAIENASGIAVEATDDAQLPLSGHVTLLQHSFRADDAVNDLGRSIQDIDSSAGGLALAEQLPGPSGGAAVTRSSVPGAGLATAISQRCADTSGWFRSLRDAESPAEALRALDRFRILCALRKGPYGVDGLNRLVEQSLQALEPEADFGIAHYHLRPILITRNDARLGLYNGDIGVVFHTPAEQPGDDSDGAIQMRAFFDSSDGAAEPRSIPPAQLPSHETCYAMTIHKSQGSEFEGVALVLPHDLDRPTPILNRELIYTGVTRARKSVEIWSPTDVLAGGLSSVSQRFSGLAPRLRSMGQAE